MISVIVPIYKVESYLRKCVDSIINQTYRDLEIILVDDGSPDGCSIICDDYALKDSRIKVIHQKNAGLSAARNIGIKTATGEYIAFVDSDDYIDSSMYETMLGLLIKENADLVICNVQMVDKNYNGISFQRGVENSICYGKQIYKMLNNDQYAFYNTAWNKLYKRELFDEIVFPVGKLHEDEFVVHKIFNLCNKIVTINNKYYFYLQRENSIMSSKMSIKRLDGCEAQYDRFIFYSKHEELHDYMIYAARGMWSVYFNVCENLLSQEIEDLKLIHDTKILIKSSFRMINKRQFRWKDWLIYLDPDMAILLRNLKEKYKLRIK